MILTKSILRGFGLKIDAGIADEVLDRVIADAEYNVVIPSLGQEHYGELVTMSEQTPAPAEIVGGTIPLDGIDHYIAGYNRAAAYIAYSRLLLDNINASTFGSVQKKDEYSEQVDPHRHARMYYALGMANLQEVARVKGWKFVYADVLQINEKPY